MHTEIIILEIIFRLCIFGLLAYKLSQLIRSYFLPFLKDQVTQEINQRTELIEKEKLLISTRHRIENQLYKQKQTFTLLEKNVQVWHGMHLEYNLNREKDGRNIVEKIQEKRNIQRKNIILSSNLNLSLPQALEQANAELTERYQTDAGKALLKKIIDTLPQHIGTSMGKNT